MFIDSNVYLNISNSKFESNIAASSGGAIYINTNSHLLVDNVVFDLNSASYVL